MIAGACEAPQRQPADGPGLAAMDNASPVAAVFANGLGDAVLALPAMRALVQRLPNTKILAPRSPQLDILFDEFSENLVDMAFDRSKRFDPAEMETAIRGAREVVFFTTWENDSTDAWLKRTAGRVASHGLTRQFRTDRSALRGHYFDLYMALVGEVLGTRELKAFCHRHQPRQWSEIDPRVRSGVAAMGDYVVIHPDTKSDKTLPKAFWRDLVAHVLAARPGLKLVVIGKDQASFVEKAWDPRRIIIAPANFALATYLVSQARGFCGIDSCFMHYADLQNIPSVAFFQPGVSLERWGLHVSDRRRDVLIPHGLSDTIDVARTLLEVCEVHKEGQEVTMKSQDKLEGRKNIMRGYTRFMDAWTAGTPSVSAYVPRRSDIGNINQTGSASCDNAQIFNPHDEAFVLSLEPGIATLVRCVTLDLGWITYTSCEGHPRSANYPARRRNIGLLPRNSAEGAAIEAKLTEAVASVRSQRPQATVQLKLLVHVLQTEVGDRPCVDLVFVPNGLDWAVYVDEADDLQALLVAALKAS